MTLKKTDLARRLASKIEGQRRTEAAAGRFASAAVPDRRTQRRLDAAAGLVPFACKLPGDLAAELRSRATAHPQGVNGLVAELLRQALDASPADEGG